MTGHGLGRVSLAGPCLQMQDAAMRLCVIAGYEVQSRPAVRRVKTRADARAFGSGVHMRGRP